MKNLFKKSTLEYQTDSSKVRHGANFNVYFLLITFVFALMLCLSANAATYTVNTTDIEVDIGGCEHPRTDNDTDCSYPEALNAVNATVGILDKITFQIKNSDFPLDLDGKHTIHLGGVDSGVFEVFEPIIITGREENDYNGEPVIRLDGDNLIDSAIVFILESSDQGAMVDALDFKNLTTAVLGVGGSGYTIKDNKVSEGLIGIQLEQGDGGTKSQIIDNLVEFTFAGISVLSSPGVDVYQNTANNNVIGIELENASDLSATYNELSNNRIGFTLISITESTIANNTVERNLVGGFNIGIMVRPVGSEGDVRDIEIVDNHILNYRRGIYLWESTFFQSISGVLIEGNTLVSEELNPIDSPYGGIVLLRNVHDNVVRNNMVHGYINGIWLTSGPHSNLIEGNTVSGSKAIPNPPGFFGDSHIGVGILVDDYVGLALLGLPPTANNTIIGNSLFDNDGLGIDLTTNLWLLSEGEHLIGVTANDLNDDDDGANNLQNFPVLLVGEAAASGNHLKQVAGVLDSHDGTYRIDFFVNEVDDPSNHGEGEKFAGWMYVTIDAMNQNGAFTYVCTGVDPANGCLAISTPTPMQFLNVTATATVVRDVVECGVTFVDGRCLGSTSEFSQTIELTTPGKL